MSSAASIASQLRSESWCGDAPRSGTDACASIPGFFGWALHYVQPLQQWFDELLGDPAAVHGFASDWSSIEAAVKPMAAQLRSDKAKLQDQDGRSIRKLRERYDDLEPIVRDLGEWTGAAAAALRLASTIVSAVRQFVCEALTSLSQLWDALFGFSLNPFEKLDDLKKFVEGAWKLIQACQRLIDSMLKALCQLAELLAKLLPLVEEALERIRLMFADVISLIPVLGGAISDLLRNSPDVEELDPGTLKGDQLDAYNELMNNGKITSPVDLIKQNGLVDRIGGENSTNISVQTVRRPDGSEYTLVTLPSTQDWAALGGSSTDKGAMNDWDSNVALMMTPEQQTQYERAVRDAMRDAGVKPGSDVVWSGFSQGGILAANMGSDSDYHTVGIITNGSPTNATAKPLDVPMLSLEHTFDPVPKLDDGANPLRTLQNSINTDHIRMMPKSDGFTIGHDNAMYADSLQRYIDGGGQFQTDWSRLNGTVTQTYVGQTFDQGPAR